MTFVPEAEVRDNVARLFARVERQLSELLPGADIQHVGSTAIPGCLTKGDLDVQVRVSPRDYAEARRKLTEIYEVNHGGFAADDATSFEGYDTQPPHGVHLTVIDGSSISNGGLGMLFAPLRSFAKSMMPSSFASKEGLPRTTEMRSATLCFGFRHRKHTRLEIVSYWPVSDIHNGSWQLRLSG